MVHTEESKLKMSKKRSGAANPFFGRKHTQETKDKQAKWTREFNLKTRQYELSPQTVIIPPLHIITYMAGFVDGEGCIKFARKHGKATPFIAVSNTNVKVMEFFKKYWKREYTPNANELAREPCYTLSVSAAIDVYVLCKMLLPFLIVKYDDAKQHISFLEKKYKDRLWD